MKPLQLSDIPFEDTRSPEPEVPPLAWALSKDSKKKAAWRTFWLLHPLMGGMNYLTHHLLRLLPVSGCSHFGAMLAPFAKSRFSSSKFSQRLVNNLKILRPDVSGSETATDQLVSNWWENISRVFAEFSVVERYWRSGEVEISGEEQIKALQAAGQSVIFISVHLGHWEAQGAVLAEALGIEVIGSFEPEPNRFTNRLIYNLRKRRGQYVFPPGQKSVMRLHKLLHNGSTSALFYIDEVRERQIHFPLLGRKTPTRGNAVAAVKLALSSNAVLVPVYMARKGGAHYRINILPPIVPDRNEDREIGIKSSIEKINERIEPVVLENLDQWYMLAELRL
nr:lysophospholipid acyltransferase family protein [uncultured Cohaesibacter sp.]